MLKRFSERGDTLIEVLFAITIFSLVVVSSLAIMNQGSAEAERSLEITLARQAMNSEAETLRFLNASYVNAFHSGQTFSAATPAGQWAAMTNRIQTVGQTTASSFGDSSSCPVAQKPDGSDFIVDPSTATFIDTKVNTTILNSATTYPQLVYNAGTLTSAQGIWVEAIRSVTDSNPADNQSHIGYIDFHIYSCWQGPGQTIPVTLATIVRLYEPR
jgi:type II secretory pathway pseudopilin PulG